MTYRNNDEAPLAAFRGLADAMAGPEPRDWEWIGEHMSQRMFGITERRAKEYAALYGGTSRRMSIVPQFRAARVADPATEEGIEKKDKPPSERAAERIGVLMAHPEDGEPTAACIAAIIAEEYAPLVEALRKVSDRMVRWHNSGIAAGPKGKDADFWALVEEVRAALGSEGGAK